MATDWFVEFREAASMAYQPRSAGLFLECIFLVMLLIEDFSSTFPEGVRWFCKVDVEFRAARQVVSVQQARFRIHLSSFYGHVLKQRTAGDVDSLEGLRLKPPSCGSAGSISHSTSTVE